MKHTPKLYALLAALLVLLLAVTACAPAPTTTTAPTTTAPTTEPTTTAPAEAGITNGIFECRFTPEGYGEFVNYIHFYPNGIFYISLYNAGQFQAGYYEVKDMAVEYNSDPEDNTKKATSEQAVVLTNLDGSDYATLAYVDGVIYDLPQLYTLDFAQVLDSGHTSADENGIAIIEFMLGDDEYSLVRLMHNGTFQDTIGEMIEGTWEQAGNVYTLSIADSTGKYTVTLDEAAGTAEYKAVDGTTQTLNLVREAETLLTFWGSTDKATYGLMEIEIACLADGKAKMLVKYAGVENKQEGTWVLADDKMKVTVKLGDVEYEAPLDVASRTFSFELPISDGAAEIKVPLTTASKVVYTFTGEANDKVIMECYGDGTCAVIYVGMGTITTGTWVMDTSAGPLPVWTVKLGETFDGKDVEVKVETDYASKFYFVFKNSSGQLEETLALPFTALQK
ncbi:MAG TPA: hypothetical protein DCM45_07170 [Clostridiales bacterium]|nr:hypothetical protein [Clostridiales bacterium]